MIVIMIMMLMHLGTEAIGIPLQIAGWITASLMAVVAAAMILTSFF